MKKLFNTSDAGDFLGVSQRTINHRLSKGEFPLPAQAEPRSWTLGQLEEYREKGPAYYKKLQASRNEPTLTLGEVSRQLGVKSSTLSSRVHRHTFPQPLQSTPRRWSQQQVEDWVVWHDNLVDIAEISEWLGHSPSQIYAWDRQIKMPASKLREYNNRYLWEWEEIQEWASNFVEWEEDQ